MAGRLLSNRLFTLQILCYTASYRGGGKALEGPGRSSQMSTYHPDSGVNTDLEAGLENNMILRV